MTLASTAKPSPLTRPASMQARTTASEHLAQDVTIAKPAVAINRERRMIRNLVIEFEAAEPTITEMKFDLLAQLPFKAAKA